ncbi:hypothetical protein FRC12_009000 [Ceratobasidium sp. 428]|nr:hypothetical protein FRC12_009000 [Ceratobasidium sp. 428]
MPPRKKNPKATATLNASKRIETARIKHAKKTKEMLAKLRAGKRLAKQQLPPEEDDDDLLVEREEETEREARLRGTQQLATVSRLNQDLRHELDRTREQLAARPGRDNDPPPIPQPEHKGDMTMTGLRKAIDLPVDAKDIDYNHRWSAIRVSVDDRAFLSWR